VEATAFDHFEKHQLSATSSRIFQKKSASSRWSAGVRAGRAAGLRPAIRWRPRQQGRWPPAGNTLASAPAKNPAITFNHPQTPLSPSLKLR